MLEDLEPREKRAKVGTRGDQEREYIYFREKGYDDAMYAVRQKLLDVIKEAVANTKVPNKEIHHLFVLYYEISELHERNKNER